MGVDRIFLCTDFCTKENGKPLPDNCGSSTCGILSFIMFGILAVGTIAGWFPVQTLGVEMLGSAPAIVGYVSVVLFIFAQGARKNSGFCVPLLKILMLMGGVVGIMLGSVHGISMDFAYGGTGLGVASFINWKGLKETIQYSSTWKGIVKKFAAKVEESEDNERLLLQADAGYEAPKPMTYDGDSIPAGGYGAYYAAGSNHVGTYPPQQQRREAPRRIERTSTGGAQETGDATSGARRVNRDSIQVKQAKDNGLTTWTQDAYKAPSVWSQAMGAPIPAGGYRGYGPPRASQGKPTRGAHTPTNEDSPLQAMDVKPTAGGDWDAYEKSLLSQQQASTSGARSPPKHKQSDGSFSDGTHSAASNTPTANSFLTDIVGGSPPPQPLPRVRHNDTKQQGRTSDASKSKGSDLPYVRRRLAFAEQAFANHE